MPRSIVAEISDQLAVRIESLCAHLFPSGHREGSEWRVGSIAGEPGDSLGIHLDGDKAGVWSDFSDGALKGDPVDLVRAVRKCSTADAVAWSKDWLGLAGSTHQHPVASGSASGKTLTWTHKLWQKTVPAPGTAVETYLHSRGITIPIPSSIRFVRALKYDDGHYFPGMISAVTSADGTLVGVHRTFLRADGLGKADVPEPKKSLGAIKGGAVHLAPAGPRLGISEGIETGLSVAQVWPALPVWAALSAPGLQAVLLPEEVRLVVILADADTAGEKAAQAAARRFNGEGRQVRIARPAPDRDFNDMLRDGMLEGARR